MLVKKFQYDPVHQGSTRRAQGKVTKVLTGAKSKSNLFKIIILFYFYF